MTKLNREIIIKQTQTAIRTLAFAIACMLIFTAIACEPISLEKQAFAANSNSITTTDTPTETNSSKDKLNSIDTATSNESAKTNKKSGSLSANDSAQKKEQEEKAKEEEAEKKRAEASKLFEQANSLHETLRNLQADYEALQCSLDEAIAQRDATQQRLTEENTRLDALQKELSNFVIEMYKQGGVTPYLDVVLRSTSYSDFIKSWSTLVCIYQKGEDLASEKRAIQAQIQEELSAYEGQIHQTELELTTVESKQKQVQALQLSLNVQAWNLNVEAAKIVDNEDEIKKAQEEADKAQRTLDEAIAQGLAGISVDSGDGIFAHPCPESTVSSGFGYREFDKAQHNGIDLAAPEGTPYYAAESGTVIAATNGGDDNGGAGNWIVIDHGDGITTKYMHSLVTLVAVGDHVERGQNIGLVGNTGNSTGSHLHFQVEVNGTAVNPTSFLNKKAE